MANLKDLIVNGVARIIGKVYSSGGFFGTLWGGVNLPRIVNGDANSNNETDLITFKEYSNGSTNIPSEDYYHITTFNSTDSKYKSQIAMSMTSERAYYRAYTANHWSNWRSMIVDNSNEIACNLFNNIIDVTLPSTGYLYRNQKVNIPANSVFNVSFDFNGTSSTCYIILIDENKEEITNKSIELVNGKNKCVFANISTPIKYIDSWSRGVGRYTNFQIELGDTAHDFVPYTGDKGVINQEVSQLKSEAADIVNSCNNYGSKNLLKTITTTDSTFPLPNTCYTNNDGTITLNGTVQPGYYRIAKDFVTEIGITYEIKIECIGTIPEGEINVYCDSPFQNVSYRPLKEISSGFYFKANTNSTTVVLRIINSSVTFNNLIIKPMLCKKSLYDLDSSFVPYALSNYELSKITYDVASVYDNYGSKNLLKNLRMLTNSTVHGITIVDNHDGTFTLNGTNDSSENVAFILSDKNENPILTEELIGQTVILSSGISNDTPWVQIYSPTVGKSQYARPTTTFTIDSELVNSRYNLAIMVAGGATVNNVIIKPMLCKKSLYDLDPTFVPYALSNRELTEKTKILYDNSTGVSTGTTGFTPEITFTESLSNYDYFKIVGILNANTHIVEVSYPLSGSYSNGTSISTYPRPGQNGQNTSENINTMFEFNTTSNTIKMCISIASQINNSNQVSNDSVKNREFAIRKIIGCKY